MHRSTKLIALAALTMTQACAASRKASDRGIPRHADGVPILRMHSEALDAQLSGPVGIDPDDVTTWRDIGTTVGSLDGKPVLVLSNWLFGSEEGKVRTNQRSVMHRNRREALVQLFEKLAGSELVDFTPEPPAYQRETVKKSKLYHLALCDAECFAGYAKAAGVEASLDQAREVLTDERTLERAKAAKRRRRNLLEKTFRDTDPRLWAGDAPWWLSRSVALVRFIDDEVVLIGVGVFTSEEPAPPNIRHKASGGRARAELGRAFRVLVERQATAAGRSLTTSADIGVTGSSVIGLYETGHDTWALAMCDQICLKETAEANEVEFDGRGLAAGEVAAKAVAP